MLVAIFLKGSQYRRVQRFSVALGMAVSEADWISRRQAGFAQALHRFEKLLLSLREDVAGLEHQVDFLEQLGRLFGRDPVAGVG